MLRDAIRLPKRLLFLLAGDCLVLTLAPVITGWLYVLLRPAEGMSAAPDPALLAAAPLYLLSLALFDCYNYRHDFRSMNSLLRTIAAVAMAALGLILLGFLIGRFVHQGRIIFLTSNILALCGVIAVRVLHGLPGLFGMYAKTAVIVGCGDSGKAIASALAEGRYPELKPVAFLEVDPTKTGEVHFGVPVVMQEGSLKQAVETFEPDVLILAMRRVNYLPFIKDVIWLAQRGADVWDAPTAFELVCGRVPLAFVDEQWLLSVAIRKPRLYYRRVKRIMDVTLAGIGLVLALPVMLAVAAAVRLDSPGPAIIRQRRAGLYGRPFDILKFRSMTANAPGLAGTPGAPTVTRVGRIIRKLHLDELPQLFNVLAGDMSLIGPRAELLDFVCGYFGKDCEHYCSDLFLEDRPRPEEERALSGADVIPYFEQRFSVQQGITGWAQVQDPFATSSFQDMLRKIEYDLYYIKNICFALDALIILKTIKVMLLGKGK